MREENSIPVALLCGLIIGLFVGLPIGHKIATGDAATMAFAAESGVAAAEKLYEMQGCNDCPFNAIAE